MRVPRLLLASAPLNLSPMADAPVKAVVTELGTSLRKLCGGAPPLADLFQREPGLAKPRLNMGIYDGASVMV
jgi:hypothetical protein